MTSVFLMDSGRQLHGTAWKTGRKTKVHCKSFSAYVTKEVRLGNYNCPFCSQNLWILDLSDLLRVMSRSAYPGEKPVRGGNLCKDPPYSSVALGRYLPPTCTYNYHLCELDLGGYPKCHRSSGIDGMPGLAMQRPYAFIVVPIPGNPCLLASY